MLNLLNLLNMLYVDGLDDNENTLHPVLPVVSLKTAKGELLSLKMLRQTILSFSTSSLLSPLGFSSRTIPSGAEG